MIQPVNRTCFEIRLEVLTVLQSPRHGLLFHDIQPVPHFPDHAFHFCSTIKVCMNTLSIMYCLITYKLFEPAVNTTMNGWHGILEINAVLGVCEQHNPRVLHRHGGQICVHHVVLLANLAVGYSGHGHTFG